MKKVQGGITTKYKYDGISVLMEKDGSNNTVATYNLSPGLIAQVVSVRRSGSDAWYHYDGLGDVMRITDSAQNVVNEYGYDAWGNILSQTEAVANQYHFTTKELHDGALGLYFFYNRWYDPEVGRFVQKDPLLTLGGCMGCGGGGGFLVVGGHPYVYVYNDPLNFIDPYGLFSMRSTLKTVWTSPNTAIGLGFAMLQFSKPRYHKEGAIYFSNPKGPIAHLMRAWDRGGITFGNVFILYDPATPDLLRHEGEHVEDYRVWGPAFLLAYLVYPSYFEDPAYKAEKDPSSLWAYPLGY